MAATAILVPAQRCWGCQVCLKRLRGGSCQAGCRGKRCYGAPVLHIFIPSILCHAASDVQENFESGHVCWDGRDIGVGGKPTGAIRASLGALSTFEEVHLLLRLVELYFMASPPSSAATVSLCAAAASDQAENNLSPDRCSVSGGASGMVTSGESGTLEDIFVYPIKSCAGQRVC